MTRRSFLAAAGCSIASAAPKRPNMLLLLGDNWAYPHASAYGDPVVRTPVFDRIAKEGVLFTHAFAPNPSCSPSRSSLLTGQETHRLGEAASLYGSLPDAAPTYTAILAGAGYQVGFSIKGWGPGNSPSAAGLKNLAGNPFESFNQMMAARKNDQPFCYWFGSHDPHVPWDRGRAHKSHMDAARVRVPAHLPDSPIVREDILNYYCEVEQFDSECGEILETLRQRGELDNTLIVMTSDNGWQIPRGLANCYDLGVRIPMAIRYPALFKPGTKRDDFVSIQSLAATFLEAVGKPAPKQMTALSLASKQRREEMFLERERHANVRKGDLSYPVRGIRTRQYLYLRNLNPERWPAGDPEFYWAVGPYGDVDDSPTKRLLMREKPQPFFDFCLGKRPAEELYHLETDPDQVRNLASDPQHSAAMKELRAKVDAWMRATADPRAHGATEFWDKAPYSGPKFKGAPPPN